MKSNILNSISKELSKYYHDHDLLAYNEAKKVGWKNQEVQHVRFQQLLKVIQKNSNFTINDLGCGLGSLVDFMEKNGYSEFNYFGYDINETMVENSKLSFPQSYVKFMHIKDSSELILSDYTVASGIFSLKYNICEADWINFVLETLHNMDEKSIKGFSFNSLTKYSDKELILPELYYSDPLFLFDYCKRNFSRNVALLHDYQEYDFTIIVRK